MSDEKISAMPNAAALTGAELVPVVQGGANVKATTQNIANLAPAPTVTITKGSTATSGFAVGDLLISAAGPVVSSVPDVAVNQLLKSGGVGASPSYTGTPTVTSITFGTGTALSDYEEGTWTPTDASGASLVITNNRSTYTKIGREVSLQMNISYPATASGAAAKLTGVPFAFPANVITNTTFATFANNVYGYQQSAGTSFNLLTPAGATVANSVLSNNAVQGSPMGYPAT